MKKNIAMRTAGALLIGVMLTTCIISGTYAKYVTSESKSDTARVAKFGVVASVSGDLFGSSYSATTTDDSVQAWAEKAPTVAASVKEELVVAPGTKNDKGMTIAVTGKPEVSTAVSLDKAVTDENVAYEDTDIVLKAGEYGVMVRYNGVVTTDTVTNYFVYNAQTKTYTVATTADTAAELYQLKDAAKADTAYYPVQWKVGETAYTNVAAVKTAVKSAFTTGCKPNEKLDASSTITWEWPFEVGTQDALGYNTNDKVDTVLGDMIADNGNAANENRYYVVKKNSDGAYDTVHYAAVNAAQNAANQVVVAYTGDEAPIVFDMNKDSIVACLTVSFGARLTVTQVD